MSSWCFHITHLGGPSETAQSRAQTYHKQLRPFRTKANKAQAAGPPVTSWGPRGPQPALPRNSAWTRSGPTWKKKVKALRWTEGLLVSCGCQTTGPPQVLDWATQAAAAALLQPRGLSSLSPVHQVTSKHNKGQHWPQLGCPQGCPGPSTESSGPCRQPHLHSSEGKTGGAQPYLALGGAGGVQRAPDRMNSATSEKPLGLDLLPLAVE